MGLVIPWREKTLVLCLYTYVSRVRGNTHVHTDGVMVTVEFEDQIEAAFNQAMWQRRAKWNLGHVGPRPDDWHLDGHMSMKWGVKKFKAPRKCS